MFLRSKRLTKMTTVFMVLMMLLSVFGPIPQALAADPVTVAAWDYTAVPASASVPATSGASLTGAVLTHSSNVTPAYSSGGLSISGWNDGAGTKYWQLSLSTAGYENLTLAAKTRSSGTGPRDFNITYSLDNGASWSAAPGSDYAITSTTLKNYWPTPTISLPAAAANVQSLLIRFIMTSNISSRAGTGTYSATETVASGGTSQINNITITGTAVPAEVAAVTAAPDSGAVLPGSQIALSCVTPGSAIKYSTDDGATWLDYSSPITLPVLPASIKAYATVSGMADGIVSTFSYTQKQAADVVTATPGSGTVTLGSQVALACVTPGSAIKYSTDDGATWLDYSSPITLSALPASIKTYATADGIADGAVSTFNYTQAQAAAVTATPDSGAVKLNSQIALSCITLNSAIKYSINGGATWLDYATPITLSEFPASIKAYASASGMADGTVSTFDYTEKAPTEYNLYFGQLHSHTTNSDGIGTPDDAFNYAKNTAKVDFLAVTDHSNSFDNASASSMANGSTSTKWVSGHASADMYTDSGFVGIYAYEMTWSNGTGHINTFNTPGFETRDNQVYKNSDGLQQYYNVLKLFPNSISQFNHPGATFGTFNDFANYDPAIDQQISLIEVGNGEGAVGSSGYFPSYDYYTRALDKGWHLSPTNNQDNHLGKWGNANTARTVVLADSLTRDNIYDAMKNMHTYATEDNNLRIKYTLNGEIMGSILPQKPGSVDIKVDLEDPDNEGLGKVSVISNGGKVVASQTLATNKDSLEFTLSPDYSYYYIRVDEADKDIAVTAPVWIGEVDKAGIASTTASSTLPMKGENVTITTSLFNNETVPMTIDSLEYSIGGSVIHTAPAISPVASLGTGKYSFTYAPPAADKFDIDVTLTATINGVQKVFTDVLQLNVADPAITTKIVVDASHYNNYVSGYYSGNMTNLVTLANGESMNVIIQTAPLTDDVLKDAQLLVLSPPAQKSGTAGGAAYPASPYTSDEIAVIKRFADRGGNLIITALADYQDNRTDATNHSAYQQNAILAAIGAGSRINDDEVIDYDNNPNVSPAGVAGGTPYRIPMNVYNMTSPYLSGVVAAQNYSFYSGCSITMGSSASWLVKGTPTTYGFDSDNDKLGGTYVSAANKTIPADTGIGKGNVVALAAETLPGGGKLFVGGTVFYSNFEIKAQLDNATQLQNSNYNITMNILDSIRKVVPVTPIAQVRSAQIGDTYCVEGTVTAGTTPGNAFFDTIYIQDETGGINIFPVSGVDIKVGQTVKVTGTVDAYQGDKELGVIEISITDPAINLKNPTALTTKASMDAFNGGLLVKIEGTVTKMDGQSLYLDDGSGEARAFVDGYIGDGSGDPTTLGKWDPAIEVGDKVSVIGLASVDSAGPRLRVRNTAEIVRIKDTVPPVITVSGISNGAYYKTDVAPVVSTNEGTLTMTLNDESYNGDAISGEGTYTLQATAVDRDENSTILIIAFTIDKTAPVITLKGINNGDCVKLNKKVMITWSCSDALSGIASSKGDIISGKALDTSKVGPHTVTFTATDKAGNITILSITYNVQYVFSGFMDPLGKHGTNSFRHGRTIPVKFYLKDALGRFVDHAAVTIYIAKITDGKVGPESKAVYTSYGSHGDHHDYSYGYSYVYKQYVMNLSTKDLKEGVYQIRIDLGDGSMNTVKITLK